MTNDPNNSPPFSIYYPNESLTGLQPAVTSQTGTSGIIVLENVGSASNFTAQCADSSSCQGRPPVVLIGSRIGTALETVFQEGVMTPRCSGTSP